MAGCAQPSSRWLTVGSSTSPRTMPIDLVEPQLRMNTTPSLGPVCSSWMVGMSAAPPHSRWTGTEAGIGEARMVPTSDPWSIARWMPRPR